MNIKMDQVLPGYAEECRLMVSKYGGQKMMNCANDILSPSLDATFNPLKLDGVQFPGDTDNVSFYLNGNRKEGHVWTIGEGEKKKLRRERNKVAASKCRNKRKEHIRTLLKESDILEQKNNELHGEISLLQIEIKELESLLDSHRCHMKLENKTSS